MLAFFRPSPDAPDLPPHAIERVSRRWRTSVFLSITLGYTVFYVTRLGMSAAKDPMIASGAIAIAEAGVIDTVFLWTYAIGKTANGFFADRASARRFFATALLVSAVANLAFGLSSVFAGFVVLWAINAWVQSVGVPVSGVVMSAWFSHGELGTRYSIWSIAHHAGEGLTFIFSTQLIGVASSVGAGDDAWRAAFIGPSLLGLAGAFVLYRTLADRPQAVGLPAVGVVKRRDHAGSLLRLQLGVLANPAILMCGVASGLVYVSRYAINNWGLFFLRHEYGYSAEDAGFALSVFPLAGIGGTLLAGPLSDRLTGGRRVPVAVAYGIVFCVALAAVLLAGDSPALVVIALACSGFAMGGLLVFLGGLLAIELTSQRTAGAALGVIGGFSYLGAGLQSLVSGYAIEAGKIDATTYDFTAAKQLWLGAPCLAVAITALLWRAEHRTREGR